MTDEELVTQALSGDQDAYTELYSRLLPRLKSTASKYLYRFPEDQQDFIQVAAAGIFKALHTFTGASQFKSWATRVAINEALTMLRSFKSRQNSLNSLSISGPISEDSDDTFDIPDVNRGYAAVEAKLDAVKILYALTPGQRRVVEAIYLKELSRDEAALNLGISVGCIKSQGHHALEKCRTTALLPKAKKGHVCAMDELKPSGNGFIPQVSNEVAQTVN
jgi:RNA polymerase sigma-70 factor, ECF subfamily